MPLSRVLTVLIAFLQVAAVTRAAMYYVAPNGSPSGNGSVQNPWDLQTALNASTVVQPGDTIWVAPGTYNGDFSSNINGTATNPVIVRNLNGGRASLNGNAAAGTAVLTVNGSYTWFWGLEVLDSADPRVSTTVNPTNVPGVGVYGPGNKFINMIVHDTMEGFSAYNASPDSEFYGNVIYYNGYVGTDRNHGHGMYFQNQTGTKLVSDNFVGDNADEGIQIYGSGTATVTGFTVAGNILYDTSSWPTPNYQYNLIIAGGQIRQNIVVTNNYSYFPPQVAQGYIDLGDYTPGSDLTVQGNVFSGGYSPTQMSGVAGPVAFSSNTIFAGVGALRAVTLDINPGQKLANYSWDNNTYYDLSGYHFYSAVNNSGSNLPFAGWQTATTFDAHSKYTPAAPTGKWIYIRSNKYEAKRANITIYNWDLSATVGVDLSAVLTNGDQYVLQDAQNFYGPPVASGTYAGNPVTINMSSLTKASAIGFTAPAHTAPQFGTFILLTAGATTSQPLPPTNLSVTVN
jgi:hypothetical protein